MAVFLDEAMMGHDPGVIGFPHILLCMGFVVETQAGLWGVHLENKDCGALIDAFITWAVQKQGLDMDDVTDVYACCNHQVRYERSNLVNWNTEVRKYTGQMAWTGPVHGFDTSVIAPRDGTYIEFRRGILPTQPCKIFYDLNEGMQATDSAVIASNGGLANVVKYSYANRNLSNHAIVKTGMIKTDSFGLQGNLPELNYGLRLQTLNVRF
jgi:hypothetical protein